MKKNHLNLIVIMVCTFSFCSCSTQTHFVTKGLPEKDSLYIVTNKGARINANAISLKKKVLTVDNTVYPLEGVSQIKVKKMYFSVKDGELYRGQIYGKINLLYTISSGMTYTSGPVGSPQTGYNSSSSVAYYLQRQGQPEIDKMKHKTFIEYVQDNPLALQKARASYLWTYFSYTAALSTVAGALYSFSKRDTNPSASKTAAIVAGISFPLVLVSMHISNHKTKKAIVVYNR